MIWYVNPDAVGSNNGTSPANAWTDPTYINREAVREGDTIEATDG